MEIRIYYEDTDCGGVVYYSNYLKYFERARTEFLRENGIDIPSLAREGNLFVVAKAEVNYHKPAVYNDLIKINTSITSIKGASFEIAYKIELAACSELLVSGTTLMASIDSQRKPLRINGDLKSKLNRLLS